MTEIGDFMEPLEPWGRGTITGRVQCQTPNMQNGGKDREEAEFL